MILLLKSKQNICKACQQCCSCLTAIISVGNIDCFNPGHGTKFNYLEAPWKRVKGQKGDSQQEC